MKCQVVAVVLASLITIATPFGFSDEKVLRKFAMDKIYESCFGEEVVRQIRQEMIQACAKCVETSAPPPPIHEEKPPERPQEEEGPNPNQGQFDPEKMPQAILAFRPNAPQPSFRPYGGMNPSGFYSNPFMNPGFASAPPMYFPGYQQYPFPYSFPMTGQPFYGNRMSRELDFGSSLDGVPGKMGGRVRNLTCVVQELGYLDENLEPNYAKIKERIANLPIDEKLRKDIQEGVQYCQQFSQCVPESKKLKAPLSRDLIRPVIFFKCYKHKKLESCLMKDIRRKLTGVMDNEDDVQFDDDMDLKRQGKASRFNDEHDLEEVAYQLLYGSDSGFDDSGLF